VIANDRNGCEMQVSPQSMMRIPSVPTKTLPVVEVVVLDGLGEPELDEPLRVRAQVVELCARRREFLVGERLLVVRTDGGRVVQQLRVRVDERVQTAVGDAGGDQALRIVGDRALDVGIETKCVLPAFELPRLGLELAQATSGVGEQQPAALGIGCDHLGTRDGTRAVRTSSSGTS
jgi:hypothetical protein